MSIDPITGLPSDALGSDLFQIPLNTKPVPLEDWQAQGRQGSFLYPDNIPPVMATVAAQHPDTSNAQSLHTDGKHALLVKDVSVGGSTPGGSSTPTILTDTKPRGEQGVYLVPLGHDYVFYSIPQYLIGLDVCAGIWDYGSLANVGPYANEVTFSICQEHYGVINIPLGGYFDGTRLHGQHTAHATWYPPYPIDIRNSIPSGVGNFRIYVYNNTNFTVQAFVSALLGPDA